MDCCLLCLKTANERIGYIRANSSQWQKENMKSVLEKHFWPMNINRCRDILCLRCWQQIKTFHCFYSLVAKTNTKYVKQPKRNSDECKIEHIAINKDAEILKEQPSNIGYMIEHKNDVLKDQHPPKDMSTDLETSNEGPLTKENTFQQLANQKQQESNKPNISLCNLNNLHKVFDEETCKKKRKNPDKNTLQEHDEMIAKHLKICCRLCQRSFHNFIELRKHFRTDHNKRGFLECCKKKFFDRPTLVEHLKFHTDSNYFKCKLCEKTYADRSTLEKHIKIHSKSENLNKCDRPLAGLAQLENHNLTHAPCNEKTFSCGECGKFFKTPHNLNYHHNKNEKVCDICSKIERNSFQLHMETHNNKLATPIHCDNCGLCLGDNRTLKQHKNSQHPVGDKRGYSCHKCNKVSPNPRALHTHECLVHESDYIHKCKMCSKDHMATHTGETLYACPWCLNTFMSNGNMYNHRKNAHLIKCARPSTQKVFRNIINF